MKNTEEFSFKEVADQLGISEEELIQFSIKEGLLNEDLTPTQWALDEGLLIQVENKCGFFSEN